MSDRENQLLDAFLEEVLGGTKPPDLSGRILSAWSAPRDIETGPPLPPTATVDPPVSVPAQAWLSATDPEPPPVAEPVRPACPTAAPVPPRRAKQDSSSRERLVWSTVAAVLVVGTSVGLLTWALWDPSSSRLTTASQDRDRPKPDSPTTDQRGGTQLVDASPLRSSPGRAPAPGSATSPSALSPDHASAPTSPSVASTASADGQRPNPSHAAATQTDEQIVAAINTGLRASWSDHKLEHAGLASDAEWCQRAFLRLVGRTPTTDEIDQFVASRAEDKRAWLVRELTDGGAYEEEFSAYWAETWARVLIGGIGRTRTEPDGNREGLVNYLRQSIHKNRPFHEVAYELVSATGSNRPGEQDYNGAVHFLLSHGGDKAIDATSRVARVFLGAQLECAQCHSHPTEQQWAQDRFWQMNAFFRQMRVERDPASGMARLVNRDFRGEGKETEDAEIYFEQRNGLVRAAYPVFVDGTELRHSGRVDEVDRRTELARMIRQSPEFGRATINRLWAHFLGFGFANPVDDIGPHNPAVLPEVWDRLAAAWVARDYDLRAALRWIASSDAFGLSSKEAGGGLADAPESGTAPRFTRFYTRPAPIDDVRRSFQLLADARRTEEVAGKTPPNQLARRVGADGQANDSPGSRTRSEPLIQTVDSLANHTISAEQQRLLDRIAKSDKLSPEQKIEHLFQAALSRKPTAQELQSSKHLLDATRTNLAVGLRDIWWVLQHSNECRLSD